MSASTILLGRVARLARENLELRRQLAVWQSRADHAEDEADRWKDRAMVRGNITPGVREEEL